MSDQVDYLEHYGVPGMKWGKKKVAAVKERSAATKERNASIDDARSRQSLRNSEIRKLTNKRLNARTSKGKEHLDRKIADKKFEVENGSDAQLAKQLKTGEKVMKGVKITAMLGMSVVGLGSAASIINSELNRIDNIGRGKELTEAYASGKLTGETVRIE